MNEFWQVDEGDERLWGETGLVASDAPAGGLHSPKYRYPGEATRRMLAAMPSGADGARTLRYVNPANGKPVMPTFDCSALRLGMQATHKKRVTYNMICLVVSGSGHSRIGDRDFEWSTHDVFTVPHWTWASHRAREGEADLFVVSDRSAFERLDLVREEFA